MATQVLQGGKPYLDAAAAATQRQKRAAGAAGGCHRAGVPGGAGAGRGVTAQDDVLRDIYTRETNAHVATVRDYLRREAQRPQPHVLTEAVYRACHTLSGSSTMAAARHGIRMAQPLDHWLRKSFESGVGLKAQDLEVLGDSMTRDGVGGLESG